MICQKNDIINSSAKKQSRKESYRIVFVICCLKDTCHCSRPMIGMKVTVFVTHKWPWFSCHARSHPC